MIFAFQATVRSTLKTLSLAFTLSAAITAQDIAAPPVPGPDGRYKADILLVVAHPDDESGDIAGYLARAIYDQHRRAAVIFITRGEESSNEVGAEKGDALGAVREIEGRRALASLGVTNVWFLGAPNTSSQNVLHALERWDHGSVLGQVVRLVRLTRPDVILTWLPASVAGENHADHQASSIVANEAFDLAGDPSAYGEQLETERGDGKTAEGLHPWQPKKIYYFSDALEYPGYWLKHPPLPSPFRARFLAGKGPVYSNTEVSETQHVPYSQFAALETSFYLTQDGKAGEDALKKKIYTAFDQPTRLIFGKSLVGGSRTADVFEGISPVPIPFARLVPTSDRKWEGISLELGGPWNFYREFWSAHQLEHLADLLPVPEVAIQPYVGYLSVPLLIRNSTDSVQQVRVTATLPKGWTDQTRFSQYALNPGEAYPATIRLANSDPSRRAWQEITWRAQREGQQTSTVTLRVYVGANGAMPQ